MIDCVPPLKPWLGGGWDWWLNHRPSTSTNHLSNWRNLLYPLNLAFKKHNLNPCLLTQLILWFPQALGVGTKIAKVGVKKQVFLWSHPNLFVFLSKIITPCSDYAKIPCLQLHLITLLKECAPFMPKSTFVHCKVQLCSSMSHSAPLPPVSQSSFMMVKSASVAALWYNNRYERSTHPQWISQVFCRPAT